MNLGDSGDLRGLGIVGGLAGILGLRPVQGLPQHSGGLVDDIPVIGVYENALGTGTGLLLVPADALGHIVHGLLGDAVRFDVCETDPVSPYHKGYAARGGLPDGGDGLLPSPDADAIGPVQKESHGLLVGGREPQEVDEIPDAGMLAQVTYDLACELTDARGDLHDVDVSRYETVRHGGGCHNLHPPRKGHHPRGYWCNQEGEMHRAHRPRQEGSYRARDPLILWGLRPPAGI